MADADSSIRLNAALEGRYRIERELGAGGMATVYLAEDLRHGRQVALKVLRSEVADALGPERFLREIETVARLTHPHVLPLHDSGQADGSLFYVMPYVEGDTLKARLEREGALPVDEAVRIASECAEALEHAHAQGIIHRDLKPANILFSGGHAVVADFGIARAVEDAADEQALTRTGMSVGTVGYMSPEQATGERTVDERTDVYALGCVLYEMLTGERAFGGRTAQAVMAKQLMEAPPAASVLRRSVPEAVEGVLQRALRRHPADRYGTAVELRAELAMAQQAGGERRARATRSILRRPAVAGMVLLTLGALAYTGSVYVGGGTAGSGIPEIRSLAVLPLQNLSGEEDLEYFTVGMTDALISDLSRVGDLKVISRTSAMQFEETDLPLGVIADSLGVDALIEGSVLKAGNDIGITLRLFHGPTEDLLWSERYEREWRDVLGLQGEVVRAVADEVQMALTPEEETRLSAERSVDPDAYRLSLMGNLQLERRSEAAFRQAIEHYREAIAIDPGYAPPYAGLAMAYIEMSWWLSFPPEEALDTEARAAALEALERDSTLAEAHIALGRIKQLFEWDWAAAEAAFRRGIASNPTATEARIIYHNYLIAMGRYDEAVAVATRAVERDPLSPVGYNHLGFALHHLGRHAEAQEQILKGLELAPGHGGRTLLLAEAYVMAGEFEEALSHAARADSLLDGAELTINLSRLAYVYARAHRRAEALRILSQLTQRSETEYVPPTALAFIHLGLDEKDKALDLLEQAYERHDVLLVFLKGYYMFEPLRGESRYEELLRRMGFPEA